MGGTCAPSSCATQPNDHEEEQVTSNLEPGSVDYAGKNIVKVINDYQADNEKLKRQLNELKSKNEAGAILNEEKARQNEEVMKELAAMKDLLEVKDRALVKGRLEAALRSRANNVGTIESTTRLCMEGKLKHHQHRTGLSKSKKDIWVEIYLNVGDVLENDFKAGYVMLTYSDSKDAWTANRFRVIEVILDESKSKEVTFSVKVFVEGATKELVLACETADQRDEWVKCLVAALDEVQSTFQSMHETFTLKLEFSKEKIGIQVEEVVVGNTAKDSHEAVLRKGEIELESDQKNASNYPEKVVKELDQANGEANYNDEHIEVQKTVEPPCELLVKKIFDEDLITAGLQVSCKIIAINDTALVGMAYSEQIKLLMNTPKPFILSFTGSHYLKKKVVPKHDYVLILKQLVADGENAVKNAFYELVKGTPFETELKSSNDQAATITALFVNQRRLVALLQSFTVTEMEL